MDDVHQFLSDNFEIFHYASDEDSGTCYHPTTDIGQLCVDYFYEHYREPDFIYNGIPMYCFVDGIKRVMKQFYGIKVSYWDLITIMSRMADGNDIEI
jgi:hypothetical protein